MTNYLLFTVSSMVLHSFFHFFILSLTLLFYGIAYANNNPNIDSLKRKLVAEPRDAAYPTNALLICAYYAENNIDSLIQYGNPLEKYCLGMKDNKSLGNLYNYYGITYLTIRDDSCIRYLTKSEAIREKIGEPKALAEIYANIARFYIYNTSKSDKALEKVRQALEIYEQLHKKGEPIENEMAFCFILLGECFKSQNLLEKAMAYFQKAAELVEKASQKDPKINSMVYDVLGVINMDLKNYDEALCYYQQAYYWIQKQEIVHGSGVILRRIGKIYFFKKDYQAALHYHKQAEKVLIADNDLSYTGYAWYNIAQDYKELNQLEAVIVYGEKAFNRGKYREIPGLIIPAGKLLADAYTAKRDFEKALYYTNEVGIAKDSLSKTMNQEVLDNLIAKYELKEKDEKIMHLDQENALKSEIVKAQKNQILAGISFTLLFLILGVVLLVNYRKKIQINHLLSQQKEELQTLNHVKDRLFSIISHDLRSPLNDLSLFLQLDVKKQDSTKMLPILSNKVFQVQQLLDNLLQWSVLQMKDTKPIPTHIEVYDLVEELRDFYKDIANNQAIVIENKTSPNAVAFCDENMLRFVLRNLLANALKFSPYGKKILITTEESDKQLILSVQDEGIGMSAETLANLFSQSGRTQNGLREEKGTGLGLLLCKEYIEKNGGQIEIESQEDIGTKVIIILIS